MLIRNDLRRQVYDVIREKHVSLLVANDVDACCAATSLMQLFACDDIAYAVYPVSGWPDLENTLAELANQETVLMMLNCGASRNVASILPDGVKVFILDSRRPIAIDNIYDDDRVRVIVLGQEADDEMKIPSPDQVYEAESDDDDDDDDDEDEEHGEPRRKRNRMEDMERRVLKAEEKKRWKRERDNILWEYYENSYTSISSSIVVMKLAAELSRGTPELVWNTSVALSSQLSDGLISLSAYTEYVVSHMKEFLTKFAAPKGPAKADDLLRIKFEKELPLALYQHWSLHEAMKVNEYFACKTRNWNQRGETETKLLLSHIGLTIAECQQRFCAMSNERKKEVIDLLDKEMMAGGPKFVSFFVHLGYSERVSAADLARALSTCLEGPCSPSTSDGTTRGDLPTLADRFELCRGLLSSFASGTTDIGALQRMIDNTKHELETIWTRASAVMNQSEIMPHGHFYLYTSTQPLDKAITGRHALFPFAHMLAAAFAAKSRGRNKQPVIVSAPHDEDGWHVIIGIMPLATQYDNDHLKSFMGRAFERIADNPRTQVRRDFFDPNIVLVKSEDRSRFLDSLQAVLETVK